MPIRPLPSTSLTSVVTCSWAAWCACSIPRRPLLAFYSFMPIACCPALAPALTRLHMMPTFVCRSNTMPTPAPLCPPAHNCTQHTLPPTTVSLPHQLSYRMHLSRPRPLPPHLELLFHLRSRLNLVVCAPTRLSIVRHPVASPPHSAWHAQVFVYYKQPPAGLVPPHRAASYFFRTPSSRTLPAPWSVASSAPRKQLMSLNSPASCRSLMFSPPCVTPVLFCLELGF